MPISVPVRSVDLSVLQWCVGTLAPASHYKAKGLDNKLQVHSWQAGRRRSCVNVCVFVGEREEEVTCC